MTTEVATATAATKEEARLLSLDAYRGLIMIALAFNGFGLAKTATNLLENDPESSFWKAVKFQFSHVEWEGCAFWDLIQPSFMFMVGVSMAYSYVKRQARGDSYGQLFLHAVVRAVVLILLGVFLSSMGSDVATTNWAFMNVLTQIGLGYPFLFLMWRRPVGLQVVVVAALLVVTWLAYILYPTTGIDFEKGDSSVEITPAWAERNLQGLDPHWHKSANVGQAVDLQVLNWFPRPKPFTHNAGGYQTINFIPSLATMLIGLICGEVLRTTLKGRSKVLVLLAIGVGAIVSGLIWQQLGCPLVKRIWTPSWALYSTGICCLILAFLYGVIDVAGYRSWSFFLVVVGMNSIAIYMMSQMLKGWTSERLKVHGGRQLYELIGAETMEKFQPYMPIINDNAVGIVFWLVCFWMAKQRIFVRV